MHHLSTEGAQPAQLSRVSWCRALPLLVRPITRTMPWVTLIAGCLAGTAYLAVMAHLGRASGSVLGQGNLRLAFLPAVAALAFVPRAPFRPLIQTTPVPAWVVPAGHLLLAAPILAVTCWAQLRVIAYTVPQHVIPPHVIPSHAGGHPPAIYPLIAQLTGWCAVTTATAACVGRSRYADLGGAIAAPVSFAAIALAWHAPITSRFVAEPPAAPHGVTIAWYAIASAASALTCAAMRDQWHRCARTPPFSLHRLAGYGVLVLAGCDVDGVRLG